MTENREVQFSRSALDEVLRSDFTSFIQRVFQTVSPGDKFKINWHIELLAHHFELCRMGKINRLIITLPPRSLKSITASAAFPAFVFGHDPTAKFICVSYSNELSFKHARDCRAVMNSAWYHRLFPGTRLDRKKSSEAEFETTKRGFRLATSVDGTLTGRGGNFIVVDDPMKAIDSMSNTKRQTVIDWFRNTLLSRLDDKEDDCIIVIMQRLHVDDLAGYLLTTDPGWVHLNLPAIAQEVEHFDLGNGRVYSREVGGLLHHDRESLETLNQIRAIMGSHEFGAQYLQDPLPPDGALIKWEWFRSYDVPPIQKPGDRIIQSWDTASKAQEIHDYSVCTTWLQCGKIHFLLDVTRVRLEFPALRDLIIKQSHHYNSDVVLIEDQGSGTQLIQELRHGGRLFPLGVRPKGEKIVRMHAQTVKIEAGQVFIPSGASWLEEFKREVLQFPRGRFDDQIDSLSQYLGWVKNPAIEDAPNFFNRSYIEQVWDFEIGDIGPF